MDKVDFEAIRQRRRELLEMRELEEKHLAEAEFKVIIDSILLNVGKIDE
jgi:hypothetical protein